ncbi:MAG: aminopeptidase P family protein [Prevotella sp.]|nr:aminopeptidase P family protein [Prevotella sp.]
MNISVKKRLSDLRDVLRRESLDAFIFPSSDPHNGEYVPEHWQGRKWISGFNGSAGTAVVTMDTAALWTDSRYFIAAENQLAGTEFKLMKEGIEGTPSIIEWLGMKLALSPNPMVGIDGRVNDDATVEELIQGLRANGGITVRTNFDPLDVIWHNRPTLPLDKVVIYPILYAGEGCKSKLCRIRKQLRALHAEGLLVSSLDDIAWTLNLRGSDVHCNPVFVAYLLISHKNATLFVDSRKLTSEVKSYLRQEGVDVAEYTDVDRALLKYKEYNILLDKNVINYSLYNKVSCRKVNTQSPVPLLKARKNATEINGFRNAMLRDGVAMVKFLRWLKPAVQTGGQTEISVSDKLASLRAEQLLYKGISFDTIAAYQEHGAIVHYVPTPESDVPLKPEGFLLLDSGAHYLDGTTDITRTIALGRVTDEQRKIYTLVLKGHIQLCTLKFPRGASGTQLDALARKDMWREGYNFLHGTGHGVGAFLNVHEGPHQIRMEYMPAPFMEDMTITDEPGLYLEGRFGVRIENVLLTVPYKKTVFGCFLEFVPLSLCPIDLSPVILSLLTPDEILWINDYHKLVYDRLSPLLDNDHRQWLQEATKAIDTHLHPM